jgi:hypothetical protein
MEKKAPLIASTMQYDFIPHGEENKGKKVHKDVVYEKEKYPEDLTEEKIELNAAPATRLHMLDFLAAIEKGTRPIADIEKATFHCSCILANISMQLGRPVVYDPKKRQIVASRSQAGCLPDHTASPGSTQPRYGIVRVLQVYTTAFYLQTCVCHKS